MFGHIFKKYFLVENIIFYLTSRKEILLLTIPFNVEGQLYTSWDQNLQLTKLDP